jgi:hypothetical protein
MHAQHTHTHTHTHTHNTHTYTIGAVSGQTHTHTHAHSVIYEKRRILSSPPMLPTPDPHLNLQCALKRAHTHGERSGLAVGHPVKVREVHLEGVIRIREDFNHCSFGHRHTTSVSIPVYLCVSLLSLSIALSLNLSRSLYFSISLYLYLSLDLSISLSLYFCISLSLYLLKQSHEVNKSLLNSDEPSKGAGAQVTAEAKQRNHRRSLLLRSRTFLHNGQNKRQKSQRKLVSREITAVYQFGKSRVGLNVPRDVTHGSVWSLF